MKITKALAIALKKVLSLSLGEIKTDKAVLSYDAEALAEGIEVFVLDENGDAQPAEDGEYVAEDGKVIVIAEGKVAEIREPEAKEEEPVAEPEAEVEMEEEPLAEPLEEPEPEAEPEASAEERIAVLEGKVASILEGIQSILNAVATLEGRLAEAEDKLAKVESEPAEEPVEEVAPVEESHTKAYYLRRQK